MNQEKQTTELTPTGIEVMHYVLLFCYNWTEEDFQIAFENSKLGWDYFWNKLKAKTENEIPATTAIIEVITNMDDEHQKMLFDYLFSARYRGEILSRREWANIIENGSNWE